MIAWSVVGVVAERLLATKIASAGLLVALILLCKFLFHSASRFPQSLLVIRIIGERVHGIFSHERPTSLLAIRQTNELLSVFDYLLTFS